MNDKFRYIKGSFSAFAIFLLFAISLPSFGQQTATEEPTELYLTFQYQGVVGVYTTAYYKDNDNTFYLAVNEVLNVLKIQHQVNQGKMTITGNYLGKKNFSFDFKPATSTAKAGDTEIKLSPDDYLIKDLDYFVKPEVFEKLLGLTFSIDFSSLTLDLETQDKLPVVAQYEREQIRKRLNRDQPLYAQNYYPLLYDRHYSVLNGAFLDYNISAAYTGTTNLLTTSNAIGAEVLGGDVQGSIFGLISESQSSFTTNNLRYRYVQRNKSFFSSAIVGQTSSDGIISRSITGVKISNKPVEPRKLFDRYAVEGQTMPESEVELYLNNQLIDYQKTDLSGNYRFVVPLTYGSTNYSIRIFTPSGRSLQQDSRIQIPFDYLPPGDVDYTASFGKLDNPVLGNNQDGYQAAATISTGLTTWLTGKLSTEYLSTFHDKYPSFTGTLNTRLFSRYLVSANANSENFYRLMTSAVYSNGTSWNIAYNYNPGDSQIYNISGNDQEARINIFTPFNIGNMPFNIRLSSNYFKNGPLQFIRYRTDLNTRLGRLNVRLGYQDQQVVPLSFTSTQRSVLTNSYTYSVGRASKVSNLFKGMFIRGQLSYLPGVQQMEEAQLELSKSFLETSRIQLTLDHNFRADISSVNINFTVDFNKIRSNTTSRVTGSQLSANQSIRGSLGYDSHANRFILNNRQQAGQAGAAIRLFIDNNNDGAYQDSVDDIINDPAVRVSRSGGKTEVKDGVNYITQLLPYYRYNFEINKSALTNPLLVPTIEKFSLITDPNQFKSIEIPFYLSGVIDGRVYQVREDSTKTGVAGLKLYLRQKNGDFTKEIHTFSDGSFYAYEIPPGQYTLSADSTQLQILGTVSTSHSKDIEVHALAQGDFITGLNFELVPKSQKSAQITGKSPEKTSPLFDVLNDSTTTYEILLDHFTDKEHALIAARQAQLLFKAAYKIQYNKRNNMYSLRSYAIQNRIKAIDQLLDVQKSQFQHAVLVVTLKNALPKPAADLKEVPNTEFSVQLGAFSSMQNAQRFAQTIPDQLNLKTVVYFDDKTELYKVRTQLVPSKTLAIANLNTIRKVTSFRDSFLTTVMSSKKQIVQTEEVNLDYGYNIIVEGTTPQTEQDYLSAITGHADVDINQSPKKDVLVFEHIENLQEAQKLKEKLAQIATIGNPIIVLIEHK